MYFTSSVRLEEVVSGIFRQSLYIVVRESFNYSFAMPYFDPSKLFENATCYGRVLSKYYHINIP